MITKLDNPAKGESKDYSNKGSVSRLGNYLTGNEEKLDTEDLFFNHKENNIPKSKLIDKIDNNVKGLTKDDHKFFSISINFSHEELAHLNNDKIKIKEFTVKAMENYAKSLKGNVSINDLEWGAIIHEKRFVTEKEAYLDKTQNLTAGQEKSGFQSHVHVIVSANTINQNKINALTATNKVARNFNLRSFQYQNQKTFDIEFDYKKGLLLYEQAQIRRINTRIDGLYKKGIVINTDKIINAGRKLEWDQRFNANYNNALKEEFKGNKIINLEDFIVMGKLKYLEKYPDGILIKETKNEIVQANNQYSDDLLQDIQREIEKSPDIDSRETLSKNPRKTKNKGRSRGFF